MDEQVTLHIMVNGLEGRRELRRVSVLGDRPVTHAPERSVNRSVCRRPPRRASTASSYEF